MMKFLKGALDVFMFFVGLFGFGITIITKRPIKKRKKKG